MKRYADCRREDGDCSICSLSSYGKDCRNAPINIVGYYRSQRGLTQQALADAAGINIRQEQKIEYGDSKMDNIMLKTAAALARALGVTVDDLLK